MKELKDERMLSSFPIAKGETGQVPLDLTALADQLMHIAGELRGEKAVQRSPSDIARTGDAHLSPSGSDHARRIAEAFRIPRADCRGQPDTAELRRYNAALARKIYAVRRRRAAIFGNAEMFGEPAWDILLDLYIAHVDGKPVSVSSACIGSAAPPTTGLRWLGVLAEQELVLREHDPQDQRRVLVRLTDRGLEAMDEFFASAASPA
ncbi:winged helix DNA-binding protein [Qipengyuania nanhaisediminis]|uniref:winged helix DNA-binding protein n=1 Tax=Qipengyuania nanhaisediminis TaxID=604088 RepID=UPI0038B37B3A